MNRKSLQQVYSFYAPFYDLVFGQLLESGRIKLAQAIDPESTRILEVGIGTGLTLQRYPCHSQVVGVDLSEAMLSRAARRLDELPGNRATLLIRADAERLPFRDHSFAAIALPYVLSVTPNPRALLKELVRVCEPGGQILILNHFKGAGIWKGAERLISRFADKIGFNSNLPIEILESDQWQITRTTKTNLLGLSRLIEIRTKQSA